MIKRFGYYAEELGFYPKAKGSCAMVRTGCKRNY